MDAYLFKQPTANKTAENAYDDIPNDTKATAFINPIAQPTRNQHLPGLCPTHKAKPI